MPWGDHSWQNRDLLNWEPSVGPQSHKVLSWNKKTFFGGGRNMMEKRINMTFPTLGIRNGIGEFWKLGIP